MFRLANGELKRVPIYTAAKANSQEPYQYLSWLFENLPKTNTDDYAKLMPWNMSASPDL